MPILPAQFQEWQEVGQISWKTQSQWNGWLGEATINFVPEINGELNYLKQISLKLQANYKTKALVFREIDWTVSTSVATIKPDNKLESDQKIYLNNVEAGESGSELLNSAEYALLPGPYVFMATGKGFTKQRVNTFFVNSTGEYISEFEPLSFELSSTQKNSAESQVEKALSNCLKKKCSDLPRLSQWDFDFSNQPTTYLYTDYFVYSWEAMLNVNQLSTLPTPKTQLQSLWNAQPLPTHQSNGCCTDSFSRRITTLVTIMVILI